MGSERVGVTSQMPRWVGRPKTRKILCDLVANHATFFDERGTVVLDGLQDGDGDGDNVREGLRIFGYSARTLRHSADKNGEKPCTELKIASVVSLPFLLPEFEGIRFSKTGF